MNLQTFLENNKFNRILWGLCVAITFLVIVLFMIPEPDKNAEIKRNLRQYVKYLKEENDSLRSVNIQLKNRCKACETKVKTINKILNENK